MKTFAGILIFCVIIFTSGCSDTFITEPTETLNKPGQTYNSHKGKIDLCCPLQDPLSGTCNINGCVQYYHQILSGPNNNGGVYTIQVNLEMCSELCDLFGMMHPEWRVLGSSEDLVFVSEEGIAILEKYYPVCNRVDIRLNVKYLVTTEGVGIVQMMIEPVSLFSLSDS